MNPALKTFTKHLIRSCGFELWRLQKSGLGIHAFSDIQKLTGNRQHPMVFDVGANIGDTVKELRYQLPTSEIHAFEPNPAPYKVLEEKTRKMTGVHLNPFALGAANGELKFYENESWGLGSMLKPTDLAWGKVVRERTVQVKTLEGYCASKGIQKIDVLKTDCEGYDFQVIKGGGSLLTNRRIQLIYMEILFNDLYEHITPFDVIFRSLADLDFKLVSIYRVYQRENVALTSDALFINTRFNPS